MQQHSPSEPHIRIVINGDEIAIPYTQAYGWVRSLIPLWLLDSTVEPPQPKQDAPFMANPGMLTGFRSGMKMMIRPWLPSLWKALYGQELNIGRKDAQPYIMKMMIDFVIMQMITHPLELEVNNGRVESVRQGKPDNADADKLRGEPVQGEAGGV